jgi:quinol monooxygenase YgiN
VTHPSAGLIVLSRFRVPAGERADFLADAAIATDTLAAQAGCRGVSIGQSTDEPDLLIIRSEWDGVGAYRRGLSAFEVKVHTVPLLSRAIDESSAYEVVRHTDASGTSTFASGLAADAGEVRLGDAAAAEVPGVGA